jgi:hypothetical protein
MRVAGSPPMTALHDRDSRTRVAALTGLASTPYRQDAQEAQTAHDLAARSDRPGLRAAVGGFVRFAVFGIVGRLGVNDALVGPVGLGGLGGLGGQGGLV